MHVSFNGSNLMVKSFVTPSCACHPLDGFIRPRWGVYSRHIQFSLNGLNWHFLWAPYLVGYFHRHRNGLIRHARGYCEILTYFGHTIRRVLCACFDTPSQCHNADNACILICRRRCGAHTAADRVTDQAGVSVLESRV